MSDDISQILKRWPVDPNRFLVRIIRGDDGRDKLQVRLDLGILQMEVDGRPDGLSPEGFPSWLDYYEHLAKVHDQSANSSQPFVLDEEACEKLWYEGLLYYQRYISFFHLGKYDLCARDTARNLRLFAFVKRYGPNEQWRWKFDQWRPYVTMVNTQAVARGLLERGQNAEALQAVDRGIEAIKQFLYEYGQIHMMDQCEELQQLKQLRQEIEQIVREGTSVTPSEPEDRISQLRRQLEEAIRKEAFEEAARIRDEIRRLTDQQQGPS